MSTLRADGDSSRTVAMLWRPPSAGGILRYRVTIDRQRQGRNSPATTRS